MSADHGKSACARFAGMYDNDPVAEVPEDKREKVLGGRGSDGPTGIYVA